MPQPPDLACSVLGGRVVHFDDYPPMVPSTSVAPIHPRVVPYLLQRAASA